jgi:hypothetical protein
MSAKSKLKKEVCREEELEYLSIFFLPLLNSELNFWRAGREK